MRIDAEPACAAGGAAPRPQVDQASNGDRSSNVDDDVNSIKDSTTFNVKLPLEPLDWYGKIPAHRGQTWSKLRNEALSRRTKRENWYQPIFHAQLHTRESTKEKPNSKTTTSEKAVNANAAAFADLKKNLAALRDSNSHHMPPEHVEQPTEDQGPPRWPTRLINIATGEVEEKASFTQGQNPPYVISSYIWSPEKLPEYP